MLLRGWAPLLLLLSVGAAMATGGHAVMSGLVDCLELQCASRLVLAEPWVLAGVLAIYVILLATPFVPGAEIGFLLLMLFGRDVVLAVYLATIGAFILSFAIGRTIPQSALSGLLQRLGLEQAARQLRDAGNRLNASLEGGDPAARRSRWMRVLSGSRGLHLAALVNTPGNSVIGGGGGIAMLVGVSRWMPFRTFLISVSVAVAPVPLVVLAASLFQF